MNKRQLFVICIICLILNACSMEKHNCSTSDGMLTLDEAKEIAKTKAEQMDCITSSDEFIMYSSNETEAWEHRDEFGSEGLKKVVQRLHKRNTKYWMITFMPKEQTLGGICDVFVDRTTGEVIDFYGQE